MENTSKPPVVFVNETKKSQEEHSPVSVIIAMLLGVTLVVFLQYLIGDLTKTFYGETYRISGTSKIQYDTNRLLVSAIVNIPAFVLALVLLFGVASKREAWKMPAMTYFVAMSLSMVGLLTNVVSVSYQLNQKLTFYGVSIVLIILFTLSVVYAQEKWLKQKNSLEV